MNLYIEGVQDMQKYFINGFLLLLPILVWNVIFASQLTQKGFQNDHLVPAWLLYAEHGLRVIVFLFPLLLAFETKAPYFKLGIILYVVGTILYLLTWIPLIWFADSAWSQSPWVILGPFATPLIWCLGIAFIGNSLLYGIGSILFVAVHVAHGLLSFELL